MTESNVLLCQRITSLYLHWIVFYICIPTYHFNTVIEENATLFPYTTPVENYRGTTTPHQHSKYIFFPRARERESK